MSQSTPDERDIDFARSQRRIENVHLVVATAVLSAYLSLSSTNSLPDGKLSWPIKIAAIASALFLYVKISIITIYPYQKYYNKKDGSYSWIASVFGRLYPNRMPNLKQIDRTLLPVIYVLFIWGSPIPALLAYLPKISTLRVFDESSFLVQNSGGIYLLILLLTLIPLALRYQTAYSQTMAHLETGSTNKTIMMGSGGASAEASIEVSNPDETNPISADDIRFLVDSPAGIDVTIGQSIPVDDEIWKPRRDVPAGQRLLLPVFFNQTSEWDSISEDIVEVTVQFQGDYEIVEKYRIRG